MAKISRYQQIFSEIELFLNAGRYEDAKVLLRFLDDRPLDRESSLRLLLINVTLDGPRPYKDEIDKLHGLLNPTTLRKKSSGKFFSSHRSLRKRKAEETRLICSIRRLKKPFLPMPPQASCVKKSNYCKAVRRSY
jgi:hypothetical protein